METALGGTDSRLYLSVECALSTQPRRWCALVAFTMAALVGCNSTVHTQGTPVPEDTGNNSRASVGGKGNLGLSAGASSRFDSAGGTTGARGKTASSSPKGSASSGGEDSSNSSAGGESAVGGQGGSSSDRASTAGGNVNTANDGGAANAGGVASSGGKANAGGAVNANGGTVYTGGATNTGGKLNNGGVGSTSVVSNGGVGSAGGKVGTGGTISTGGTVNTGGRIGTGGTVSTGGTTSSAIGGCDLSKPFGAPTMIYQGDANSSETSISVQDNGLSALISLRSNDASSSLDLRRYLRGSINDKFGTPMEMRGAANINTSADEGQVRLSRDGNDLYFTRTLADSTSAIYNAKRNSTDADFPVPSRLDTFINFTSVVGASWIAPDNSYFYWVARDQNFGLYRAEITASGFANRMAMAVINSTGPVMAPAFTDDQKTLYFASNGSDASALEQVWRATRQAATSPFGTPTRVTELADSQVRTYPQDVSPDGCILYLAKTTSSNSTTRHLYQAVKPRQL